MKFTKEGLVLRLINDIKEAFPDTSSDGESIIVIKGDVEIRIPINTVQQDGNYNSIDYNGLFKNYKDIINEMIEENTFKVNYHNLYPVIRSSDFGQGEEVKFQRRKLFLDLDLLYVMDYQQLIRFLTISDKVNMQMAHEAAMFNINKISNTIQRLNTELEIYSAKFDNDYNCSLIFNTNFMRQVKKHFGVSNYLISIPSGSSILLARDLYGYVEILKDLIKSDSDPNVVSNRIYRVSKGKYSFAD